MKFVDFITEEKLLQLYNEKIVHSVSKGVDRQNNYEFNKRIKTNIIKIINDVSKHDYTFKPYKIILIPKDVNSKPRKVCIPTIRDRLVIEALKEYLYTCYEGYHINYGISNLISNFIDDYNGNNYSRFIKADLTTYFDTINHNKLLKKLKKVVNDPLVINMIDKIIKNDETYNSDQKENKVGVPQGLSISMMLANIYMLDIDNYFKNKKNVKYYRYVDDIFIFCNKNVYINFLKLKFLILKNKLKLNRKKTKILKISHPFTFLGYSITDSCISVKKQSKQKLENSIEQLFKKYKLNKNKEELLWRLNIRISGAICNNKKYGWLFYYNKINDVKLLYKLDSLVDKFKKRYNVEDINNKTFVNTYYQIKNKNIKDNNYFFNADKLSNAEKRKLLISITNFSETEVDKLSSKELEFNYRKAIFKCLKSLEMDLDSIS